MEKMKRASTVGQAVALAIAVLVLGTSPQSVAAPRKPQATFTNPILPSGPDPWVSEHRGAFYYTHTLGNRIALWRTKDIADLASVKPVIVWQPPKDGPNAHSIWAPELHRIDRKWYIYYSATASGFKDDAHRAIFVLENASEDPLKGKWVDRGRVNTRRPGIDGTVFRHLKTLYFAYSPYVGDVSGIALARLANPWTIAGEEVLIATPSLPWEDRGGRKIMEGPEFLAGPNGRLFMTYSAGACWSDDYALGLLSARPGRNLVDADTWVKAAEPVLKSANGVFATGHNGFFKSPDGREQWIIFHANSGPGMGCTARRAPHLGRMGWDADGTPIFPSPAGPDTAIAKPSAVRGRQ